jgi:arginyl-tRNA--protein-N-Asp/Glu arginylyltransferase
MYLKWNSKIIKNFSEKNIANLYDNGFVFTRENKGSMDQTRSLRINLDTFELTSENKRILRKTEHIFMKTYALPYEEYHWSIGKLAKNFYDTKFKKGTFSAQKIKELLTNKNKSNFNTLFIFSTTEKGIENEYNNCKIATTPETISKNSTLLPIGYAICHENKYIFHYSYPFYHLEFPNKNIGMGMMIRAIEYAKKTSKQYVYLGSAQRPTDTYKLQFKGLEWFDGNNWRDNMEELKEILKNL